MRIFVVANSRVKITKGNPLWLCTRFISLDGPGVGGDILQFWRTCPVHQGGGHIFCFDVRSGPSKMVHLIFHTGVNVLNLLIALDPAIHLTRCLSTCGSLVHYHYVRNGIAKRILFGFTSITISWSLTGSFLIPINRMVADLPLKEDKTIC